MTATSTTPAPGPASRDWRGLLEAVPAHPATIRMLLVTNGTVTDLVEALEQERIVVQRLEQERLPASESAAREELCCTSGEEVMRRRVALRGADSHEVFVLAESLIVPARLPRPIVEALCSEGGIGDILAAERLETYREIVDIWHRPIPAWGRAVVAAAEPAASIGRTYRIVTGGSSAMVIREWFLATLLLDGRPGGGAA